MSRLDSILNHQSPTDRVIVEEAIAEIAALEAELELLKNIEAAARHIDAHHHLYPTDERVTRLHNALAILAKEQEQGAS